VIAGSRKIAVVVELACDGIGAMGTGSNVWSFRHNENTKLRPKQESELRQKPLYLPREVSDLEESPDIDGTTLKNMVPIHVGEARGSQVQP
jgi:hypothetical protein